MKLKTAINRYVLGDVLADDLPAVAREALADGHESASLRQLAGATGLDMHELRGLFSKALDELGLPLPSTSEAGIEVARSIAEDVIDGRTNAYQGAKRIWREIFTRFPGLTQLKPFVGFASEYEDDEKHRDEYARLIVEECRILAGK